MGPYHTVLIYMLLVMIMGCNSNADWWLHPRRCAIRNESPKKITEVQLRVVDLNWETLSQSLDPGETKIVTLPSGRIPVLTMLAWTKDGNFGIRALQNLSSMDSDYHGDILFTIYGHEAITSKAEAVDLDNLEIVITESEPPSKSDIPKNDSQQ